MSVLNYDVLRIFDSSANVPALIRARQVGFETDRNHRMAAKNNGGQITYYPAEQYDATFSKLVTSEIISTTDVNANIALVSNVTLSTNNADINLNPGGTGVVSVDGNLKIDNVGTTRFSNSAISHGVTDVLPTDTGGEIRLGSTSSGSLYFLGINESTYSPMQFSAISGIACLGPAHFTYTALQKAGTTTGPVAAYAFLMAYYNDTTSILTLNAVGDLKATRDMTCTNLSTGNVYATNVGRVVYQRMDGTGFAAAVRSDATITFLSSSTIHLWIPAFDSSSNINSFSMELPPAYRPIDEVMSLIASVNNSGNQTYPSTADYVNIGTTGGMTFVHTSDTGWTANNSKGIYRPISITYRIA